MIEVRHGTWSFFAQPLDAFEQPLTQQTEKGTEPTRENMTARSIVPYS